MSPQKSSDKSSSDNINNIVRGLSLLGIVWVVNTTNITASNLLILTNEVSHVKVNQGKLKADLLERMSDRFTGSQGDKLEDKIDKLDSELNAHKEKETH